VASPGATVGESSVLITTRGASSTVMGAICKVKSTASAVVFDGCAKARGSLLATTVAHPNRTKSLRFI